MAFIANHHLSRDTGTLKTSNKTNTYSDSKDHDSDGDEDSDDNQEEDVDEELARDEKFQQLDYEEQQVYRQ